MTLIVSSASHRDQQRRLIALPITMGYPPPSPPLKSTKVPQDQPARIPRSTVDPRRKQDLLAKLKASSTDKTTKQPAFKIPALPTAPRPPIQVPLAETAKVTAAEVRAVPPAGKQLSAPVSKPPPTGKTTSDVPGSTTSSNRLPKSAPQPNSQPQPLSNPSTLDAKVPQITEAEAMARDFGYRTAEEIDLHKRVNKHVNGYLKKTCGIPGGVEAYTRKEAWKVRMVPHVTQCQETDYLTTDRYFQK